MVHKIKIFIIIIIIIIFIFIIVIFIKITLIIICHYCHSYFPSFEITIMKAKKKKKNDQFQWWKYSLLFFFSKKLFFLLNCSRTLSIPSPSEDILGIQDHAIPRFSVYFVHRFAQLLYVLSSFVRSSS